MHQLPPQRGGRTCRYLPLELFTNQDYSDVTLTISCLLTVRLATSYTDDLSPNEEGPSASVSQLIGTCRHTGTRRVVGRHHPWLRRRGLHKGGPNTVAPSYAVMEHVSSLKKHVPTHTNTWTAGRPLRSSWVVGVAAHLYRGRRPRYTSVMGNVYTHSRTLKLHTPTPTVHITTRYIKHVYLYLSLLTLI